jgi:hypothetical protein
MILMVTSGFINSSTAYKSEKDGIANNKRIKLGIVVQIISNLILWVILEGVPLFR